MKSINHQHHLLPTNFNNKIKMLSNLIFLKYAKNDKMNYHSFVQWLSLHPNFLKSFDRCFRPNLWMINKEQNQETIGINYL